MIIVTLHRGLSVSKQAMSQIPLCRITNSDRGSETIAEQMRVHTLACPKNCLGLGDNPLVNGIRTQRPMSRRHPQLRTILELPEPELMKLVHELCYRRRFNATVHALNKLSGDPSEGFVALLTSIQRFSPALIDGKMLLSVENEERSLSKIAERLWQHAMTHGLVLSA